MSHHAPDEPLERLARSARDLGRDDPAEIFRDFCYAGLLTAALVGIPWLLAWGFTS